MPEHVHLLVWPTEAEYNVGAILNSIKQSVAKRALAFVRSTAPAFLARMEDRQPSGETHNRFWQRGGGYDRNIVEETTLYRLIEYLHANPVRRGLCLGRRIGTGPARRTLQACGSGRCGWIGIRCQ